MGVPNTTTFTLQNVVDVVDNDDNLVGVFNDAVASKFDSAYSGAKNNLLNFRNYDAAGTCTSFLTSSQTFSNGCSAAPSSQNATYYHNGSNNYPVVGDTVYTNSSCTTTVGSGNRPYYTANGNDPFTRYTTNASGVVTAGDLCGV